MLLCSREKLLYYCSTKASYMYKEGEATFLLTKIVTMMTTTSSYVKDKNNFFTEHSVQDMIF